MPTQPKVNPVLDDIGRSFNGKTVQEYTITFPADVSGSLGPDGAVQAVYEVLGQRVTPVLISALKTGGTVLSYYVEGEFPTDDYNDDGTPVTFEAHLQTEVQALGTVDTIALGSATVAAGDVFYADQIPA